MPFLSPRTTGSALAAAGIPLLAGIFLYAMPRESWPAPSMLTADVPANCSLAQITGGGRTYWYWCSPPVATPPSHCRRVAPYNLTRQLYSCDGQWDGGTSSSARSSSTGSVGDECQLHLNMISSCQYATVASCIPKIREHCAPESVPRCCAVATFCGKPMGSPEAQTLCGGASSSGSGNGYCCRPTDAIGLPGFCEGPTTQAACQSRSQAMTTGVWFGNDQAACQLSAQRTDGFACAASSSSSSQPPAEGFCCFAPGSGQACIATAFASCHADDGAVFYAGLGADVYDACKSEVCAIGVRSSASRSSAGQQFCCYHEAPDIIDCRPEVPTTVRGRCVDGLRYGTADPCWQSHPDCSRFNSSRSRSSTASSVASSSSAGRRYCCGYNLLAPGIAGAPPQCFADVGFPISCVNQSRYDSVAACEPECPPSSAASSQPSSISSAAAEYCCGRYFDTRLPPTCGIPSPPQNPLVCMNGNRYVSQNTCVTAEPQCTAASSSQGSPGSGSSASSVSNLGLLAHWTFDDIPPYTEGNYGTEGGIDVGPIDEQSHTAIQPFEYWFQLERTYDSWPPRPPLTEATCTVPAFDRLFTLVDRECLSGTSPCTAMLCLWRTVAQGARFSSFLTVAAQDQTCDSVRPATPGYVLRDQGCTKPDTTVQPPRCLERICAWGKQSTPRQTLLSAAGPSTGPVTCAGSSPADRFTLVSTVCRERNAAGQCLAELCLWEKVPACYDGVDNDGDNLIDAQDPGCLRWGDDDERDQFVWSPGPLLSRLWALVMGGRRTHSLLAQTSRGTTLIATDVSGNGNHGTISGARPVSQGCLWLDGIDDYVAVPNFDRQRFTFAGFVKNMGEERYGGRGYPPIMVSGEGGGWGIGFVKGMGSTTENTSFPGNMAPYGPARIFLSKTQGRSFRYTPGDVSNNTFHHVAVTYDGATVRFYVDGQRVSEQAYAETFVGGGNYLLGFRRTSGDHPAPGQEYISALRGLIDDFRVYSDPLTDAEIALLAAGTPCVLQTSSASSPSSASSVSSGSPSSVSSSRSSSSSSSSRSSSSSTHTDSSHSSSSSSRPSSGSSSSIVITDIACCNPMTGLCRLRDPCSIWEIEYDSLSECNASCRPASSSSSRSSSSSSSRSSVSSAPATHTYCNAEKQCKVLSGPGTNQCTTDADCNRTQHLECFNNTCRLYAGAGRDLCANDADCTAAHTVCLSQRCAREAGAGSNQCSTDADCLRETHLACVARGCKEVSGAGSNLCARNEDCLQTHAVCRLNRCEQRAGVGLAECASDADCAPQSSSSSFATSRSLVSRSSVSSVALVSSVSSPTPQCADGRDNDGDARSDAQDPGCHTDGNPGNPATYDPRRNSERDPLPTPPSPPVIATCGNGVLNSPSEECDDGNRKDFDGCARDCKFERAVCGDGVLQSLAGEQCDPPLVAPDHPFYCGPDCRWVSRFCGDGVLNEGEQCDDGRGNSDLPDARCRKDCGLGRCGDGIIDDRTEECDDGRRLPGDGCDRFCRLELPFPSFPSFPSVSAVPTLLTEPSPPAPPFAFLPPSEPSAQSSQLKARPLPQRTTETGPELLAVLAAGAAGGLAWMRRKKRE